MICCNISIFASHSLVEQLNLILRKGESSIPVTLGCEVLGLKVWYLEEDNILKSSMVPFSIRLSTLQQGREQLDSDFWERASHYRTRIRKKFSGLFEKMFVDLLERTLEDHESAESYGAPRAKRRFYYSHKSSNLIPKKMRSSGKSQVNANADYVEDTMLVSFFYFSMWSIFILYCWAYYSIDLYICRLVTIGMPKWLRVVYPRDLRKFLL